MSSIGLIWFHSNWIKSEVWRITYQSQQYSHVHRNLSDEYGDIKSTLWKLSPKFENLFILLIWKMLIGIHIIKPHTLDSIINPKPQESDLGQQRGAHKLQVANKAHKTASHQASTRATHKTARQQDSLASISSAPGWLLLHLERRHENRRNLRQKKQWDTPG